MKKLKVMLRFLLYVLNKSSWYEWNNIVYFTVVSDGATGRQWIERLTKQGFKLTSKTKELLLSLDFDSTNKRIYKIAVVRGSIFNNKGRRSKVIRADAVQRKFITPTMEIACLIRQSFSDEELESMRLSWIVTMHNPVSDFDNALHLLRLGSSEDYSWLNTSNGYSDSRWSKDTGFAFIVSQRIA